MLASLGSNESCESVVVVVAEEGGAPKLSLLRSKAPPSDDEDDPPRLWLLLPPLPLRLPRGPSARRHSLSLLSLSPLPPTLLIEALRRSESLAPKKLLLLIALLVAASP